MDTDLVSQAKNINYRFAPSREPARTGPADFYNVRLAPFNARAGASAGPSSGVRLLDMVWGLSTLREGLPARQRGGNSLAGSIGLPCLRISKCSFTPSVSLEPISAIFWPRRTA